jgi:NDP-sugar pyrophosphorylase family protein
LSKKELKTAMILAAGFGTRLQPLTLSTPKALVNINGKPMIQYIIEKLIASGIQNVVVNTHHFKDQLQDYFKKNNFGIKIHLSIENEILGTGGGIKYARKYLESSPDFLVYNTDVFSDLSITDMFNYHNKNKPFATLVVKERETSRPLLMNDENYVIGRKINNEDFLFKKSAGGFKLTAFCGIHIISSEIFNYFPAEENFDIISFYMDLLKKNYDLLGYDIKNIYWEDAGKFK